VSGNSATPSFEFATATRIIFGTGKLAEAPNAIEPFGRRVFVVTGRTPDRAEPLLGVLSNFDCTTHCIPGEPKISDLQAGLDAVRDSDVIVAIGGGSAIDAGKAIAALATNPGEPQNYLEVIGSGQPLTEAPLPFIAIPTTAGTGAEVTRNAVLASPEQRVKVSLRHPLMLPNVAIVDPELTYDLPPAITAATGMDALTQLIEPFTCRHANPLTDALCREAIPRAATALPRVYAGDQAARTDMTFASLSGGLALANAGLGAVHGFAAPLGGMFPAPHGAVCAALLPHVFAANARHTPERFVEVSNMLGAGKTVEAGTQWLRNLAANLNIPGLAIYGIAEKDFPALISKARNASSMKANPVDLSDEELTKILAAAM
jgi:alcohol dehydrogenase class IV